MARCDRLAVDLVRPSQTVLQRAATEIRRGSVVAIPTDTLYGLAADPFSQAAVNKIFRIKRRPETMPILLLVDSLRRLEGLIEAPPDAFYELTEQFWPGPLTVILRANKNVPECITAGSGTVAVRLPRSPLVRMLARLARRPLTGTSANISGRRGARSADEVARQLGDRLDLLLDAGPVTRAAPSTIVDLSGDAPTIIRAGAIPISEIARALKISPAAP